MNTFVHLPKCTEFTNEETEELGILQTNDHSIDNTSTDSDEAAVLYEKLIQGYIP